MKKYKIHFSFMQMCYWCLFVCVNSYALTFFFDYGIGNDFLGIMAASAGILAFVASFFIGNITDKINNNRLVYILGNIILIILVMLIYLLPKDKWLMLILYSCYVGIITPLLAVLDSWIIKSFSNDANAYAPIRSWGSLAYCLFALVFGRIIAQFGYVVIMLFGIGFAVLNILTAIKVNRVAPKMQQNKVNNVKVFFEDKKRVVFLSIIFLSSLANAPILIMIGPIIKSLGGATTEQGIAMFLMGILQMPIIMLTPKFSWISPYKRFFVGIFLYLACSAIIGAGRSILAVYIGALFNDVGFSLYMPSMREIISNESPNHIKSTALTIADAFGMSLAGAIGSLLTGILMEIFGLGFAMGVSVGLAFVAMLIMYKYIFNNKSGAVKAKNKMEV